MSLCLPEKERENEREREKKGWFLVVGCHSKLPPRFEARHKSVDRAALRLRISDLDQRETLCTQRSEACLRVFTCENKGEESSGL